MILNLHFNVHHQLLTCLCRWLLVASSCGFTHLQ